MDDLTGLGSRSYFAPGTLNLEQLDEAADDELYRAKRAGKNRVAAVGRR